MQLLRFTYFEPSNAECPTTMRQVLGSISSKVAGYMDRILRDFTHS